MKVRLKFKTEIQFLDVIKCDENLCEGNAFESAMRKMFDHVVENVMRSADLEDEVPTGFMLAIDIELPETGSQVVPDRTPKSLFALVSKKERKALKAKAKKGVNHNG